ncbi:MAG TPA: CoA transferase [Dehalococcoidia bacterium]|nr:CoA transferase [Dehalococcoidia bacterium]
MADAPYPSPETAGPLPLHGVRVVDFSWIVAGPQATRILADFGADVIRVEYAGRIDSIRIGLISPDTPPGSMDASGFFNNLNRNKRSITLNINDPRGLAAIKRLLTVSDIVIENYSAGVMERKGLSYAAMAAVNPAIIYLSVSGFGHKGRDREHITWGPTAQAVSGLTYMSGLPAEPSAGWGYSYLDHTAGYFAALAALFALWQREQTGQGQYVDCSQIEAGMVLAGPAMLDRTVNGRPYRRAGNPPGNRATYPTVAPHNTYRCRGDDRWIAIAVETEAQWAALVEAMGSPAWAAAPEFAGNAARLAHQDELDARLGAWTAGFDPFDLMLLLQAGGVPAGAVQNIADRVERDPQLRERGFYPEAEHGLLGRHRFEGVPFQMSRSQWRVREGAPLLGAHNGDVLCDLLGLADEELLELTLEAAAV